MARHGENVVRRRGGMCRSCTCNDGNFDCRALNRDVGCDRSDPVDGSLLNNCMMDGRTVQHGESMMVSRSKLQNRGQFGSYVHCREVYLLDRLSSS